MEWALALAAMLAVVAVFFVARPFLRDPSPASDRLDELAPEARERLALAEERDRALAALKELEFDHRTGKISDEDYRELIGTLRLRVAEALRALEPTAQPSVRDSGPGEGVRGSREVPPKVVDAEK